MLHLHKVKNLHTGEMIAETVNTIMETWGIRPSRILTVITDNGSSMVKAFRQYFQEPQESLQGNESNYDDEDCGADEDHVVVNTSKLKLIRLPCVIHMIQLVVIACTRSEAALLCSHLPNILCRRYAVHQKLISEANKTVILDIRPWK